MGLGMAGQGIGMAEAEEEAGRQCNLTTCLNLSKAAEWGGSQESHLKSACKKRASLSHKRQDAVLVNVGRQRTG